MLPKQKLVFCLDTIERYLSSKKQRALQDRLLYIDQHAGENVQSMLNRVLDRNSYFPGLTFIKNRDNDDYTTKPGDVKSRIKDYMSELYDSERTQPEITITPYWSNYFKPQEQHINQFNDLNNPFTLEELNEVIDNLGNGTAPGPDRISYEFIKKLSSPLRLMI